MCTLYDKAEPTQTRLRMSWSSAPGRTINSRLAVHTAKSGGGWATRLMESPILMHAQLQQLRTNTAAGSTFTFMTTAVGAAAISNVRLIFVPRQGRQGRLLPTACTACSNPWDSMAKGTALRGTRSSRRPGSLPEALSVSKASTPTCLPRGRRKPGRCAERRIRRPSSSAFGRMRVTDATVHPHALHLATPMYRPGSLCSSGHVTEGWVSRSSHVPWPVNGHSSVELLKPLCCFFACSGWAQLGGDAQTFVCLSC